MQLREAMASYSSAFLVAYKSHADQDLEMRFDLKGLTGNIIRESVDEYFTISAEAIDALTHMAYIQWKYGKLAAAEKLLIEAIAICEQRPSPHKLASQEMIAGFFYFRTGSIDKAEEHFRKAATQKEADKNSIFGESSLPPYITNTAHEALACCHLSKNTESCLDAAEKNINQVFGRLNAHEHQRRNLLPRTRIYEIASNRRRLDYLNTKRTNAIEYKKKNSIKDNNGSDCEPLQTLKSEIIDLSNHIKVRKHSQALRAFANIGLAGSVLGTV